MKNKNTLAVTAVRTISVKFTKISILQLLSGMT